MTDPLLRLLEELPQTVPDRVRAARVRSHCHAALARGRQFRGRRASNGLRAGRAFLMVLGVAYLEETFRLALHMLGMI